MRYNISTTLYILTLIFGFNMLFGCSPTKKSFAKEQIELKTDEELRSKLLGVWLPLDTLDDGEVYLNHHFPRILKTEGNEIYLLNLLDDESPDKCIAQKYDLENQRCTLDFVYSSARQSADYGYTIELINEDMTQWNYFDTDNDKRTFNPYHPVLAIREGSKHDYKSYNNTLPKELENKSWNHLYTYRGDFYYRGDENGAFLKTETDSIAMRDPYSYSLVPLAIKHSRTIADTTFVYDTSGKVPYYKIVWVNREKGIILFYHPWEDVYAADHRLLIDSTKNTKELLPSFDMLLAKDVERTAFYQKWKEKGYTEEEIGKFIWYRSVPKTPLDEYESEGEDFNSDSDVYLQELKMDYDGDGLEDQIDLIEDYLYEKDINHDHLDYTIDIIKKLDEDVYIRARSVKVTRPMLESFSIDVEGNDLLILKYDVYANRNYDTWEYKDKTLAEVDSVNSYTYRYKYNPQIEDWSLMKIEAVIKTPNTTTSRSIIPIGRTLYKLDPEMNPLDDIE